MASIHPIKPLQVRRACEDCAVRRLCLPAQLDEGDLHRMNGLVTRKGPLRKGDFLYRAGSEFRALYAVQGGAVKTYGVTDEGEEQVTGFHLPGELVGTDAIQDKVHACSAVALEKTWVCELPYTQLEQLGHALPSLQTELMAIMSQAIRQEQDLLLVIAKMSAEKRVSRFLHSLYHRMCRRMGDLQEIQLPMTRQDIGNYLGLSTETVSRALSALEEKNVIGVRHRTIRFLNPDTLQRVAC